MEKFGRFDCLLWLDLVFSHLASPFTGEFSLNVRLFKGSLDTLDPRRFAFSPFHPGVFIKSAQER